MTSDWRENSANVATMAAPAYISDIDVSKSCPTIPLLSDLIIS